LSRDKNLARKDIGFGTRENFSQKNNINLPTKKIYIFAGKENFNQE
jgi:hypothetical protein